MDRMDQFLLGKPKYDLNHPAIKTGFESIDSQTTFLRRGTLALLGSRPGMGKTTICLLYTSAKRTKAKDGVAILVLFFPQLNAIFRSGDMGHKLPKLFFVFDAEVIRSY